MKIINKDILTVEKGIICSQVNCQSIQGSGLAKSIKEKWPVVYTDYMNFCKKYSHWPMNLLGEICYTEINKTLTVAQIFGQFNYGYDGKRYSDYCAINNAFEKLRKYKYVTNLDIYFPARFSSDRGGADWNIVSEMIEYYFPDAIICKLN